MIVDLSTEIAGIRMKNPVMNASGTFDLIRYYELGLVDTKRLGAYVHKSIDYDGRDGNPQPRMYEVVAGIINRIGLQNPGVIKFIEEILPQIWAIIEVPLIVSVAGKSVEDYLRTISILEKKSNRTNRRIDGFEINISCPNVEKGMIFGTSPKLTAELIAAIRKEVSLPLIAKLTPNVTDISEIAKAAEDSGVDAISLINTLKALARIRGYEEDGKLKGLYAGEWIEGGLSGPTIKPIALYQVSKVVKTVKIPVIGMGGIINTEDALDFLRLGAKAVAVGTATFMSPLAIIEIIDGLDKYMREHKYANLVELREKEGI